MDRYLDLALYTIGVMALGATLLAKLASDAFDRRHAGDK